MRAAKRREGNGGGAHRGCSGRRSGLGDVLRAANRRWWWSEPEVEHDGDGGSTGRPASCVLTGSFRARGRSSCACRGDEGRPVAAAMANGGDRRVRTRERESEGEGEKHGREGGEARGSGRHQEEATRRRAGRAGRQAGWWRGAVARARAGHAPLPLSRTKTTEEEAGWAACWLGRPAPAGLHRGEPQVSFSSLFLFSIFF